MKRSLLMLLLLCLLLSACAKPAAPETTHAPGPTVVTTAAPVTEPAPTEPETKPAGYRASGSRTSGGVLVHTDPSAYAPYSGSGAKYTRLREGPLDRFEPSEDYGAVYPYEAAIWYDVERWDIETWVTESGYTYGFVDGTGRILTDGIYRSVYCLDGPPGTAGLKGYWVAERVVMEPYTWSDGTKEYTGIGPSFQKHLISMDGSRMMECPYNSVSQLGNQILCRNTNEEFSIEDLDFQVLDYDLKTVFTDRDVIGYFGVRRAADYFKDAEYKNWVMEYGDGLLLLSLCAEAERENEYGLYTTLLYPSVFCDESGALVAGPFAGAEPFSEGLACASPDGEHYGFIDKSGAWVIEPVYRSSDSFRNGQALLCTEDGRYVVIDRNGSECFSLGEKWCYRDDDLYVQYQRNDDNWTGFYAYYDPSGNCLIDGNELRSLNAATFYSYDKENGVLSFRSPERRLLAVETDNAYPSRSEALIDGELTKGWNVGWAKDWKSWLFVPEDCSRVIELPYYENAAIIDSSGGCSLQSRDPITGEQWYFFWNGTGWDGATETGERLTIPLRSSCPKPMGDLIGVCTEYASYLMTPDGKIVFCYPIDTQD